MVVPVLLALTVTVTLLLGEPVEDDDAVPVPELLGLGVLEELVVPEEKPVVVPEEQPVPVAVGEAVVLLVDVPEANAELEPLPVGDPVG